MAPKGIDEGVIPPFWEICGFAGVLMEYAVTLDLPRMVFVSFRISEGGVAL
jgi:hypothetical protein